MGRLIVAAAASLIFAGQTAAQDTAEVALVKRIFADLQPVSVAMNTEYCGYIGYDANGVLIASDPTMGGADSCLPDDPHTIDTLVASYHTHGAYSDAYFNEVPSGEDVEGDEAEGIDGYVATPAGRLWYVDTQDMIVSQICGIGCLPRDPQFQRDPEFAVAQSYSYADLVQALND